MIKAIVELQKTYSITLIGLSRKQIDFLINSINKELNKLKDTSEIGIDEEHEIVEVLGETVKATLNH